MHFGFAAAPISMLSNEAGQRFVYLIE